MSGEYCGASTIAMTRVTMLSSHDAWLEGIRVDPAVRGMDVATDLQVAELHWIVDERSGARREQDHQHGDRHE